MPRIFRQITDYRAVDGGVVLPPVLPPPSSFGTDIGNWITQPGGQTLTVPNGTYTAREVSDAAHAAAPGTTNGGNLVLVAQTPGSVIVDMSPPGTDLGGGLKAAGDLVLSGSTQGVIFVGFKFINGTIQILGNSLTTHDPPTTRRISFWYTEHSFPFATWAAEAGHSTGDQYHVGCRAFDLGLNPDQISIYGGNIHNTGTGVIYRPPNVISGATQQQRLTVIGTKIYSLSDGGPSVDPRDIVHPTAISAVAGLNGITMRDSLIHSGLNVSQFQGLGFNFSTDAYRSVSNLEVTRVWVRETANNIILNNYYPWLSHRSTFTDVYTWDGILTANDSPGDKDWVEAWGESDGQTQHAGGEGFGFGHNIVVTKSNVNIHVAGTGTDPATAWQATSGQGAADWSTYFTANGWP